MIKVSITQRKNIQMLNNGTLQANATNICLRSRVDMTNDK